MVQEQHQVKMYPLNIYTNKQNRTLLLLLSSSRLFLSLNERVKVKKAVPLSYPVFFENIERLLDGGFVLFFLVIFFSFCSL